MGSVGRKHGVSLLLQIHITGTKGIQIPAFCKAAAAVAAAAVAVGTAVAKAVVAAVHIT